MTRWTWPSRSRRHSLARYGVYEVAEGGSRRKALGNLEGRNELGANARLFTRGDRGKAIDEFQGWCQIRVDPAKGLDNVTVDLYS